MQQRKAILKGKIKMGVNCNWKSQEDAPPLEDEDTDYF
jgi:hypothetical protein